MKNSINPSCTYLSSSDAAKYARHPSSSSPTLRGVGGGRNLIVVVSPTMVTSIIALLSPPIIIVITIIIAIVICRLPLALSFVSSFFYAARCCVRLKASPNNRNQAIASHRVTGAADLWLVIVNYS